MGVLAAMLAAAGATACDTDFEDAAIVIDLRILGMRAEPPEVVAPVDPEDPASVDLADLEPIEVCALVADPGDRRELHWEMRVCPPGGGGRCDRVGGEGEGRPPIYSIGSGTVEDPERDGEPVSMCATIEPDGNLVAVLQESVRLDDLAGFGGVTVQVELRVTPDGGGADEEVVGYKRVRYSPQIPAERVANQNPTLDRVIGIRAPTGERGLHFDLPLGRCGAIEPWPVSPGERVTLLPIETPGAREDYVVPTFDGGARSYTENLRYQWLATAGDFSRNNSGGELDGVGNEPPLDTRWIAPRDPEEVGDGLDVRMWFVQRDERGGQTWYESCARVVP